LVTWETRSVLAFPGNERRLSHSRSGVSPFHFPLSSSAELLQGEPPFANTRTRSTESANVNPIGNSIAFQPRKAIGNGKTYYADKGDNHRYEPDSYTDNPSNCEIAFSEPHADSTTVASVTIVDAHHGKHWIGHGEPICCGIRWRGNEDD
jgi:hypothetical protein